MRPGSPALDTRAPDLARYLIIVRRDRPDVFETLQQHFAEPVIGDRRTGERRDWPSETRTGHGFVLVHPERS